MNPETPPRKPRSDCLLKNLSAEQQEAIADYGATHSIAETRDWIVQQHKLNPGRTAVFHFLSSMRIIDQRYANKGAVHGLVANIETDTPLLSSEDLQHASQRHFAEKVINDSDVSAFNQAERTAVRREELEIQRQELRIKLEEAQIQRERLKLDREKFQRTHIEMIVRTCKNPKVRKISQDDKKNYTEKIAEIGEIMFGDE